MNIIQTWSGCLTWRALFLALLTGLAAGSLPAADLQLPTLKSGTDVYTNVTVYSQTETDLYISHSRGLGNVKISTLDKASLRALGLPGGEEETAAAASDSAAADKVKAAFTAMNLKVPSEDAVVGMVSQVKPTPQMLMSASAIALLLYVFFCHCLKLICVNAGTTPGGMIWFPLLQMFPLLRAARMPAWWFIVFFVPFLNLLAHVLWSFRIAKACGKGPLVAVFLLLPLTNLLAFLYLAFSKNNADGPEDPVSRSIKLEGLAEA